MSLSPLFDGLPEVRGALTADPGGRVLEATPGAAGVSAESALATATATRELAAAGNALGVGRLELVLAKGPSASTVAAVRPDALLLVAVEPLRATKAVEHAAQAWANEAASATPPPRPPAQPGVRPGPAPAPAAQAVAPGSPKPFAGAAEPRAARSVPPVPAQAVTAPAPGAAPGRPPDPWAALRRALVRRHLTEAVALQRELAQPAAAATAPRPGSEPVSAEVCDRAVQVLLQGIGSVIAGDGCSGDRILRDLADPAQQNLSFRWLALHWSAHAAMKRGSFPTARAHVKEALELGRQLDVEARAVSQWTAAEVLAHDRDPTRALAWLAESRGRFERLGDAWGLGQTWLTEARVLVLVEREQEAVDAARRAWAADPGWDEPPLFLARRALLRDDLAEAEELLRPVRTPAVDRVRVLIEAIRKGTVTRPDAAEFLREHDAPPTQRAIQALARIARTSPGFAQAREALAWMLLKVGKYRDAGTIFRELLSQPLSPGDRASVMLGLGCISSAQEDGGGAPAKANGGAAATAARPAASGQGGGSPVQRLSTSSIIPQASQAGGVGGLDAVFSGQLGVFALPDLLEFLRSAKRTGLLVCSTVIGMGALRFRDGLITAAASPATPGVAEVLLRARKITPVALRAVAIADTASETDQVVGERLVREGFVDAAAVQEAFELQIGLAVRELVEWKDGEFAFNREAESDAAPAELSVAVDPQAVLLNLFKDMDEAARGPVAM